MIQEPKCKNNLEEQDVCFHRYSYSPNFWSFCCCVFCMQFLILFVVSFWNGLFVHLFTLPTFIKLLQLARPCQNYSMIVTSQSKVSFKTVTSILNLTGMLLLWSFWYPTISQTQKRTFFPSCHSILYFIFGMYNFAL